MILVAHAYLFAHSISSVARNAGVHVAALDDLRQRQPLGSQVFAPEFLGCYDLVRSAPLLAGIGIASGGTSLDAITALGTARGRLVRARTGSCVHTEMAGWVTR